jgi:hypothetical protein
VRRQIVGLTSLKRAGLPRTPVSCGTLPAVSLLSALNAFFTDRRTCGELAAGVEGPVVWIACPCGASMARRADADDRA